MYNNADKMFTEKVVEYIGKGYAIHTSTMIDRPANPVDEIARVDLSNGSEIIRVLLTRSYGENEGKRLCVLRDSDISHDYSNAISRWAMETLEEHAV